MVWLFELLPVLPVLLVLPLLPTAPGLPPTSTVPPPLSEEPELLVVPPELFVPVALMVLTACTIEPLSELIGMDPDVDVPELRLAVLAYWLVCADWLAVEAACDVVWPVPADVAMAAVWPEEA